MSKKKNLIITPPTRPTTGKTQLPPLTSSKVGEKIYWSLFEAMKGKCTCAVCVKLREIGEDIQKGLEG